MQANGLRRSDYQSFVVSSTRFGGDPDAAGAAEYPDFLSEGCAKGYAPASAALTVKEHGSAFARAANAVPREVRFCAPAAHSAVAGAGAGG